MTKDALIFIIAMAVTVVWTVAALVAMLQQDPTIIGVVTPVMLIIAGGVIGFYKNGKGSE